jgi:dCMP deaminase
LPGGNASNAFSLRSFHATLPDKRQKKRLFFKEITEMTDDQIQDTDRKNNRPNWDDYFMDIAELVSKRSTCLRRGVGAVLVKDRRVLATGYNGSPSGLRHCLDIGCMRREMNVPSGERHELCRGLHAEQNAIIQAASHGVSVNGSTLYCTNHPCIICAKMIINAGIVKITFRQGYMDKLSENMLEEANIIVSQL